MVGYKKYRGSKKYGGNPKEPLESLTLAHA